MVSPLFSGVVPAVVLGVEPVGYSWPAGTYQLWPGPTGAYVVFPCRCGGDWIAYDSPAEIGAEQSCDCIYDDRALAAVDRVWAVAMAAAIAAGVNLETW